MARKSSPMEVVWVPVEKLVDLEGVPLVNHEYQRSVKPEHLKEIEQEFHEALVDPLRIWWKNGEEIAEIWDGQHTAWMLINRGWKALPCFPLNGTTNEKDLARLFVLRQKLRKPLRPLEVFKAELFAGNTRAVAINKIVAEFDLRIASGTNNGIAAVKKVEKVFDAAGADGLRAVLTVITRAWQDDRDRLHGNIILGLHNYLEHERPERMAVDEFIDRLVGKLSRVSPVELLRKAHASTAHEGGGNIMAAAVENEIRKAIRRRRL
jgi:hypothetical protein